jgi:indole-3-glycerol phosphate synthase
VTVLDTILFHRRRAVEAARLAVSPQEMQRRAREAAWPVRGFRDALASGPRPRIVAEIKRRSPSRGEIRPDLDPVACARAYAAGGAAAISVLTEPRFFGGEIAHLEQVREAVSLPLLRKDFVFDPYQIDEARAHGADAVLLIAAAFDPRDRVRELSRLHDWAVGLDLDVLVEVHEEAELDAALQIGADLIGVNNRDLRSFQVDLSVTERLAKRVPRGVVLVAESGISNPEDVLRLEAAGASAFLVGESLMREADLGAALRLLRRRS